MSVQPKSKSFFSTTAGAITGVAGVLTAVVGIIGAATQLGWIGSKDDKSDSATTTTTAASTQTTLNPALGGVLPTTADPGSRSTPTPTSANARFDLMPKQLELTSLAAQSVVTVKNNGTNTITFDDPSISGVGAASFRAVPADPTRCRRLDAGLSCQIEVRFAPSGGGPHTAVLSVKPTSGIAQEVALTGRLL